ncbi:MAG: polysialic acid transporter [Betaproteobacteria bacterium HGW-Betaproteobacteria-12]|nr:MAG: polysialic acid transporter [Betaproteobacteria bacterium HGW-Betaproteobacteria-12]
MLTQGMSTSLSSSAPKNTAVAASDARSLRLQASPVNEGIPPDDNGLQPERRANLASNTFGANLFTGKFAKQSPGRFNPEYSLMIGDQVQVRLWGGFEYDGILDVDPQGNLFLPHVGPVKVLGVMNRDLQKTVETAVAKVFRANVFSYASLAAPQPVRIFVGGFVQRPGLYNGTSMDSLLSYLDQAGGIDPDRGSFLNIQVKRGDRVRASIDLYEFLLAGRIPLVQLAEGDVLFVQPRQSTVHVTGLVANANRFEFAGERKTVADLMRMAQPNPEATHVRVVRNTGDIINTEYYPLADAGMIALQNGDGLEFTADKKPGTITVRVQGEHQSPQEYVLPYGAKLGELMRNIRFYDSADSANIQLVRLSVRERQKQMLSAALRSLETAVLTARSATNEESRLRKDEAELMLQWVERARKVEPSGQVIIAQSSQRDELLLENGDVIHVPKLDGLVLVSGEVIFPNAIAYDADLKLKDYIKRAGGYAQSADTSRIIVAHRDGSYEEAEGQGSWFGLGGNRVDVKAGDQILVLPKVQTKSIEVARGITQILYQIAIAAKVALDL